MITPQQFQAYIENSYDYSAYRKLLDELLEQGLSTGPNQSEVITAYAKMNIQRMKKWDKIFNPESELGSLIRGNFRKMIWLIITEGWCGDAAQSIPQLVKIAGFSTDIKIRFLLRDENPELMEAYLTNGAKSIPKLIALDEETCEELFNWGPRPVPAQEILLRNKAQGTEYVEELHKWYAVDKGITLQSEIFRLLKKL